MKYSSFPKRVISFFYTALPSWSLYSPRRAQKKEKREKEIYGTQNRISLFSLLHLECRLDKNPPFKFVIIIITEIILISGKY